MVVHQPTSLRLLFPPDAVRPAEFPKTGDKLLDKWVDLSTFVVLGEVGPVYPSQSIPSPLPLVCLETGGRVVVYYHTAEWAGRVVEVFASDLPGYLRSWLVYKEWVRRADREIEALRRERRARLKALYNGLSEGLQSADPMGFADKKISLWPHRARNLAEDGLADSDEF